MASPTPDNVLNRLEWTAIRRLDGLLQGDHRTLFRGFGVELAGLREYQFGDDVRYIDWNVTARMQSPYIRQYVEDRDLTAWFLLDLSPSLDFGTIHCAKRDLLIDLFGVLARVLTRRGNRVGAIVYSDKVDNIIPPASGRLQVLRVLKYLLDKRPLSKSPLTELGVLLDTALRTIRRRCLVFIVSDFISEAGWERPLSVMARRHEVVAVRLYDPREIELPDMGPLIMEDAETGEQLFVDTNDRGFRKRFAEGALRRESELESALARPGAEMLTLSTADDIAREIVRFAVRRKQRRGGRAISLSRV